MEVSGWERSGLLRPEKVPKWSGGLAETQREDSKRGTSGAFGLELEFSAPNPIFSENAPLADSPATLVELPEMSLGDELVGIRYNGGS